jgi:pyruvate formate lyase activating enzyme
MDRLAHKVEPEEIAEAAVNEGCSSVAFTYNDPVIFAEYAIDTARECRKRGVHTVAVTAGYITDDAREEFFADMDAANVDLKGFSDHFYHKLCKGQLQPVLDTLMYLRHHTKVWLEITTLLIPSENDSSEEIDAMTQWIASSLGTNVPLHFSAFHPDYNLRDKAKTPLGTLIRARDIAHRNGLQYVYTGNVHDSEGSSTHCPNCKALLIERDWYTLGSYNMHGNQCAFCNSVIPGVFPDFCSMKFGKKWKPMQLHISK